MIDIQISTLEDARKLRKAATDKGYNLSVRALEILYIEFCNIQQAEWLLVDDESLERFFNWLATGDDDEAWS